MENKRLHKRHRTPNLDRYVVFSLSVLLIYTCVALWASFKGVMNDTLTTCVYACFGGEVLSCALIKIYKLKEPGDEESKETNV